MDSLINEALWKSEFDCPMPEGMTYAEFAHTRDKAWTSDDIRDQTELLQNLKNLTTQNPLLQDIIETEQQNLTDMILKKIKLETEIPHHD
jgi:hypothetical protein